MLWYNGILCEISLHRKCVVFALEETIMNCLLEIEAKRVMFLMARGG